MAVAWRDVSSGRFFYLNARRSFHAASTVKLGLMMEAYRRAARGDLSLDARVPIYNHFHSAADGSVYELRPDDDADKLLYGYVGQAATVRDLVHRTICLSSNLAANILLDLFGADPVNRLFRRLGAPDVVLRRGFMDLKAYDAGINNTATARGLLALLLALALGRLISAEADLDMVHVMMGQVHRDGIPAGLPDGVGVANKTGWFPGVHHDASLVFPPGRPPYGLVILTEGFRERPHSAGVIAELSALVYSHALAGGLHPPANSKI
ncbi:MAG: serine hydrolase [Chthonomonadales bacterium]